MGKKPRDPNFEGLTYEDLRRELGFDDLGPESCFRELFGDAFDLGPPRPPGAARVTQTGPGRRVEPRTKPNPKPDPEEK